MHHTAFKCKARAASDNDTPKVVRLFKEHSHDLSDSYALKSTKQFFIEEDIGI